jgi:hypothetical protein
MRDTEGSRPRLPWQQRRDIALGAGAGGGATAVVLNLLTGADAAWALASGILVAVFTALVWVPLLGLRKDSRS